VVGGAGGTWASDGGGGSGGRQRGVCWWAGDSSGVRARWQAGDSGGSGGGRNRRGQALLCVRLWLSAGVRVWPGRACCLDRLSYL
jgi:hypothetical protein